MQTLGRIYNLLTVAILTPHVTFSKVACGVEFCLCACVLKFAPATLLPDLPRKWREFCGKAKPSGSAAVSHPLFIVDAYGQMNTADIAGTVSDPTGAVVPQATVTALQLATQQKHTGTSNDAGQYLLAQLPLGDYKLTVDAQGFKQAVQTGIVLHAADHLRQDFSLELGEASQSVTVEANAGTDAG